MATTNSSHCRHWRYSSGKSRQKRVAEEVSAETLIKFVRKHKTLAKIAGVAITAFFAMYVFVHMIAPPPGDWANTLNTCPYTFCFVSLILDKIFSDPIAGNLPWNHPVYIYW